jgi:hypothetical protein
MIKLIFRRSQKIRDGISIEPFLNIDCQVF